MEGGNGFIPGMGIGKKGIAPLGISKGMNHPEARVRFAIE
jgi:hypothetical protein